MTRHLLKLVWHRKRSNALVIAEIFFSFLVVFAVVTLVASLVTRWNIPLGYDRENLWVVRFDNVDNTAEDDIGSDKYRAKVKELVRETLAFPQVEGAALAACPPYSGNTWNGDRTVNGRRMHVTQDGVTDGYLETMKMKLVRGRWFSAEDEAATYRPVVIDTNLATAAWGTENPVGKEIQDDKTVLKVVGVVEHFRKDGEFTSPDLKMMFHRVSFENDKERAPRNMVVRVRPGTTAELERVLSDRLHAAAPNYSFRIRRIDSMRRVAHRVFIIPAVAGGIVALFLMTMVGLGLTGVLWQTVTRRIRELGLRRSLGATGVRVRKQILAEVAILSTLAVIVGVVVVAQLPLLGILTVVTMPVFLFGVLGALLTIYAITLLCGVYPAWLASRIEPADALRYE